MRDNSWMHKFHTLSACSCRLKDSCIGLPKKCTAKHLWCQTAAHLGLVQPPIWQCMPTYISEKHNYRNTTIFWAVGIYILTIHAASLIWKWADSFCSVPGASYSNEEDLMALFPSFSPTLVAWYLTLTVSCAACGKIWGGAPTEQNMSSTDTNWQTQMHKLSYSVLLWLFLCTASLVPRWQLWTWEWG